LLVTIVLIVVVISLMIGINALYVAGEFAAVSARKARIIQAAQNGNRLAKSVLPILEDHHKLDNYIAASQVGITLSSVVLGIYGQQQIAPLLAPLLANLPFIATELAAAGIASLLVLIVLTALQVVLGELVPKSIALQYPEQLALLTAIPMRWSADLILRPLIILLNGSGALVLRLLGVKHEGGHRHVHSPEEIQLLIQQSHEGGLLDAEERELLDNALRVGDLNIGDILVPRTRMVTASVDTPLPDLLRLAATSAYTRIPVYERDIDHILGIVHIKDLFRMYHQNGDGDVRSIIRPVSFVPESKSVQEVWEMLNQDKHYLAIVLDEYGGTVGMVTMENLIEELFGEVQDEFDEDETPLIQPLKSGEFIVHGETTIVHLNDELGLSLPVENAHTVNGLILEELGRMPQVGDIIRIDGVEMRVQTVRQHMVDNLLLTLPNTRQDSEETA
jgi:putative hemolysin